MDINTFKRIYFIGIGGIGMSALARYFKAAGKGVAGYDRINTNLIRELINAGINIHFEDNIELIEGNVLDYLENYKDISFCFLDTEKEIYEKCYDIVIPNMVSGGILIADNAKNHYETLKPMLNKALNDKRMDALIVPIGMGLLVCRKL